MPLKDQIDRSEIVNKISFLINNLPKDEHFCLSINGSWGSGKSFVLGLIEEKFLDCDDYFIVKYDAWKNNFYSDPLIAILYCILDALRAEVNKNKDKKAIQKSIQKALLYKVRKEKIIEKCIDNLHLNNGWVGLVIKAIVMITDIIHQANKTILDNEMFEDFKSYQQLLDDSISALNRLTADVCSGKQRRCIILVDEIDRCLPEEQMLILERLHHLFQVKNCAVIVAINRSAITKFVEKLSDGDGDVYLKKFFNYNFTIQTNYRVLLRNSLNYMLDEINEKQSPDNLLFAQDTDYIARYLIKICQQRGASSFNKAIQRFSNRDVEHFLSCTHKVCDQLNGFELNYCYLWFIYIMTFEKLFGGSFNAYKDGTASFPDWYEIAYMDQCQQCNSINYNGRIGTYYYPVYSDIKINTLKFMYTQFVCRNSKSDQCFGLVEIENQLKIEKIWDMKKLEDIMNLIDNYS